MPLPRSGLAQIGACCLADVVLSKPHVPNHYWLQPGSTPSLDRHLLIAEHKAVSAVDVSNLIPGEHICKHNPSRPRH